MDDLLREFLTETSESLDTVDNQLVRFEQDPSDAKILDNIFRLVHTIKGTCGFLGLPRLEALAHAGETLMGKFRDGMPVKAEAVTLILSSIDRIKEILAGLEATETEPEGTDEDLIEKLHEMAEGAKHAAAEAPAPAAPVPVVAAPPVQPAIRRQGYAGRPGAGTPAASRRSLARRSRTCLPRNRDRSRARAQARAGRRRQTIRARRRKPPRPLRQRKLSRKRQGSQGKTRPEGGCRRRARRPGSRQDRQPVDPRQRGHAGTSDDHGLRAGADPQPAAGNLPPQRGHRVQGAAAAAVQRHRRAAGRRHEDADAADRQCLAEAAPHRPRPLRRTRQADRTRDARRRHRTRPPGARPDQGSVDAHGAQLRRPRPGDPGRAAGLRQGRAGHHPSLRLSRGRPHHHLHRRQWPRAQHRADQGQGSPERSRQRGRDWRR